MQSCSIILRHARCVIASVLLVSMMSVATSASSQAQEAAKVEVVTQIGHFGGVFAVAFLPDGKHIVSGGGDETLKLWDIATGMLIRTIGEEKHGNGNVRAIALSPDGNRAVAVGDFGVALWDLASGDLIRKFDTLLDTPMSAAISRDGRRMLSGNNKTVKLWDLNTGELLRVFEAHTDDVEFVTFLPDGRHILSGGGDKTAKLWDAATGKLLRTFSQPIRGRLAVSSDGKLIVVAEDDTLTLIDTASGKTVRTIHESTTGALGASAVAVSPDRKLILVGANQTLRLVDSASGSLVRSFDGHKREITSVAFSPDGALAASSSYDNTIKLWNIAAGTLIRSFEGQTDEVTSVAFGERIYTVNANKKLRVWSSTTGQLIRTFDGLPHLEGIAAVENSQVLLAASNKIELLDTNTGDARNFAGHAEWNNFASMSMDRSVMISGGCDESIEIEGLTACIHGDVKLWDFSSGTLIRNLSGHDGEVTSIAISSDGTTVVSGGCDSIDDIQGPVCIQGRVKLWETATGKLLRDFGEYDGLVTAVAISPSGDQVLAGSYDGTLRLWDSATGQLLHLIKAHSNWIRTVAFSPDGSLLLSAADWENTLKLWDTKTGELLRNLEGHNQQITSATFSRDGRSLLSGSKDATARIWDVSTGKERVRLVASNSGTSLGMTPDGIFTASDEGMLSVVRGLAATVIGQVHQSLYNPDLVREALAGDPDGEVKRAAEVINLDKVIDSGPAPLVQIISHPSGGEFGYRPRHHRGPH